MNDPLDPRHYQHFDPTTAFALRVREAAQLRSSAERLVAEGAAMFEEAQQCTRGRAYSITRVIHAAVTCSRQDGLEGEWSEEIARRMNMPTDPAKPFIPWSALAQRSMIAGTAAQGGYLVGAPAAQAVDVLVPFSTCLRLGSPVLDGLAGNVLIPRVTTSGTASWLGETGTAAASDQVLGQIAATPKRIAAYTEFSRQLLAQGPTVEAMVANKLLGVVGRGIDQAMLSGTGTDAPVGILNTVGITKTTGTGFDHAAAQAMLKNVAAANVIDEGIKFLGAPTTRELLAKRGINGTGADQFIWQRNSVADKPAYVSGNVAAAQLYAGDFLQAWLLMWGTGIQLEINPFTPAGNFQADIFGMKVVAHADVAIVQPSAFHVSTGITSNRAARRLLEQHLACFPGGSLASAGGRSPRRGQHLSRVTSARTARGAAHEAAAPEPQLETMTELRDARSLNSRRAEEMQPRLTRMSKTNQQEQEQAKPPSKAESDENPAGEIRLRRPG